MGFFHELFGSIIGKKVGSPILGTYVGGIIGDSVDNEQKLAKLATKVAEKDLELAELKQQSYLEQLNQAENAILAREALVDSENNTRYWAWVDKQERKKAAIAAEKAADEQLRAELQEQWNNRFKK